MGVCNCSMFCCTLLYVHSSIAIILMGKRELVALLNLSSWCLVMVERLFLAVIVVFPDHTHSLFLFGLRANSGPIACADWMGYPKIDKRGFSLWITYMYIYVFVTLFLFDLIILFVLFFFIPAQLACLYMVRN